MSKKLFPVILILLSIAAGVYFRFYPRLLPYLDLIARQEVYSAELKDIEKNIETKYPGVKSAMDARLIDRLFEDRLKSSKTEIESKVSLRGRELKGRYRDEQGHVYLNGIDSYYWLRLLENLITKGHIGDRVLSGVEFDDLIGSPVDPATKKNVHIWLGLFFYKAAGIFDRQITLEEVLFFVPIVLSVIVAIFSFITARRLGCSYLGSFFASFVINLSPFLMVRSTGEWFDTDIYNVLFPLLAFWAFLCAFQNRALYKRLLFSFLSAAFLACYASTWKGWWFIFDIMIVAALMFGLNQRMSRNDENRREPVGGEFALTGIFFFVTGALVTFWNGFSVFKDFISEPLKLTSILKVTQSSVWPNVYSTVAELGKIEPFAVVTALGSPVLFFAALSGIVYIFLTERTIRDERYGFGILCIVFWIIGVFYASLEAMRFVLLLVVPVGLAFGLAFDRFYRFVTDFADRYLKKHLKITALCTIVPLFCFFMSSVIMRVHSDLVIIMPMMDDNWHEALVKIKTKTPKDAQINSWWDFGHWFKAVACRRVLFDGMTQNTPYAYWIAASLLSPDEEEAVSILRMVNVYDNEAVEMLQKRAGLESSASVEIIRTLLKKDKDAGRLYLEKLNLPGVQAGQLLDLLFPRNLPPVYFIVSYDMAQKIGPISYIGNWDFKKVDMWFKKKSLNKDDFLKYLESGLGYSEDEANTRFIEMSMVREANVNKWFSRVLGLFSPLSRGHKDGNITYFDNGLVVNLDNNHAFVSSDNPARRGVLKSLVFFEDKNGSLKTMVQKDPVLGYSALLMKNGDEYQSILMDEDYAKSMLARLYFLKGKGLKHFKLFDERKDDKGNAIYVYQVVW